MYKCRFLKSQFQGFLGMTERFVHVKISTLSHIEKVAVEVKYNLIENHETFVLDYSFCKICFFYL